MSDCTDKAIAWNSIAAKNVEIARLLIALNAVKDLVCGDRAPHWVEDGWTVTATRGLIADICNDALNPNLKQPLTGTDNAKR